MKKIILVLLAMALMCSFALAEEGTALYTHPAQGYGIRYPADWLLFNYEHIDEDIDAFARQYGDKYPSFLGSLQRQRDNIVSAQMAYFLNTDAYGTLMIAALDSGEPLDAQDIIPSLISATSASYAESLPGGIQIHSEGAARQIGDRTFYNLAFVYEMGVSNAMAQYYLVEGSWLYMFTASQANVSLADMDAWIQSLEAILATFTPSAD